VNARRFGVVQLRIKGRLLGRLPFRVDVRLESSRTGTHGSGAGIARSRGTIARGWSTIVGGRCPPTVPRAP
jgi:hypothetical protein